MHLVGILDSYKNRESIILIDKMCSEAVISMGNSGQRKGETTVKQSGGLELQGPEVRVFIDKKKQGGSEDQ